MEVLCLDDVRTVDAALAVAVVVMVLGRALPLADVLAIVRVNMRRVVRVVGVLVERTRSRDAGSKR